MTAAKEAGIPVVPIYNGDSCGLTDIKDHIDGKVVGLGRETEVYNDLIKYVFKEQIVELVSTQHAADTAGRIAMLAERIRALPAPATAPPSTEAAAAPTPLAGVKQPPRPPSDASAPAKPAAVKRELPADATPPVSSLRRPR